MRVWVVVVLAVAVVVAPVRASMALADMRTVEAALVDGWGWSMIAQEPELAADFVAAYRRLAGIDPWSASARVQLRAALLGVSA